MEILTLLKANLRRKKGTFISIMFLTILITTSAGAILSVMDNSSRALDKAFATADCGDIAVYMSADMLTQTLRNSLENHSSVGRVRYMDALYAEDASIGEREYGNSSFLTQMRDGILLYNAAANGFEENIPPLAQGEIYLPFGMKASMQCEIGDTIRFSCPDGSHDFRIAGFVQEPTQGSANMGWKQVFISAADYEDILDSCTKKGTDASMVLIMIYKASDCTLSAAKFSRQLNLETKIITNALGALTKDDTIRYTMIFWNIISSVLLIFVALLFVIVLIVMGHSISTEVEIDYVNLGILKAQGFTSRKIRQIILSCYLSCELAGGIIGSLFALPLSLLLGQSMMQNTAILPQRGLSAGKILLLLLAILVISAAAVGIKTKKVGKISPIRAISCGRKEIYFDSRFQLPVRHKGLLASLALRQLTSGKKRYIGTVFIVAILTFFMFSVNLLGNLLGSNATLEAMGAEIDDVTIRCVDPGAEDYEDEMEALVETFSPIRKRYYTAMNYISLNGENLYCSCYKYPEYINGILKGRAPMYDNEVLITQMVAERLDIGMGDLVLVSNNDLEAEFIVSGIFQNGYDSGLNFAISFDGAKKLGIERITSIGLCVEDSSKSAEIVDALNREFGGIFEAEVFDINKSILNNGMVDGIVNAFKAVIYIFSILFAFVVVEMVCSKSFAKERTDIGILKAVGFSCTGLRISFAVRFFALSLIGSALGMVLSASLSARLIGEILSMAGFSKVRTEFTFFTVIVPVLLMGMCFFVFAYAAARKVKKVEVRELVAE